MFRFIAKRLIMTVFVIIAAAVLIFSIMYFIPGDPAKLLLGSDATPQEIHAYRVMLGLEDAYPVRLGKYLYNVFIRFDLGTSWTRNISVTRDVLTRLPRTFFLATMFIIISSAIAIPLGIAAAVHQNGLQDKICMVVAMVCASVPDFWLALVMAFVFSQTLHWLPSFGIESWQCYIMPIAAGSLRAIGPLARQTRSSMLDVIRSDFVTTARAKGEKEKNIIYSEMVPNALIPVVTTIGTSYANSIAGTIVIEAVFSMPGIGLYITNAIASRDYPVIQGCVIIFAAVIAAVMLLVDLVYAGIDPRIKAQYVAQSKRRAR
jgi:peptide/nickel transport system permease protein